MRKSKNMLFVQFLLVVYFVLSVTADDFCVGKTNGCFCEKYNGEIIDLLPIAHDDGTAKFENVKGDDGLFYSYNPCFNFTQSYVDTGTVVNQCRENVAACAHNTTAKTYNATAYQTSVSFGFEANKRLNYINYPRSGLTPPGILQVFLHCHETEELRVRGKVQGQAVYEMDLYSPCLCAGGCQGGISPGSIILIIFFAVIISYFIVGMLANKVINGATGREIIPNYRFWAGLPSLIRDGYMFFLSPCLGDRVQYNNVYQNI